MRQAEYDAFAEWIKAGARDPKLRDAPKLDPSERAAPERPAEVIRHDRADRLLESFENTVWAMRFRCMGCHAEGTAQNQKNVKEYGERVAWMKADGPAATLAYLRTTKLIDVDDPEKSLLLLKPLGAVKHGGGKKFVPGDQGYKAFRDFLDDYAKTVRDEYAKADDLPKDDGPERFGTRRLAQAEQHAAGMGRPAVAGESVRLGRGQERLAAGADRVVGSRRVGQGQAVAAQPRPAGAARVGAGEGVESRQTGVAEGEISGESVRGREGPPGRRLEGEAGAGRLRRPGGSGVGLAGGVW